MIVVLMRREDHARLSCDTLGLEEGLDLLWLPDVHEHTWLGLVQGDVVAKIVLPV